MTFRLNKWLFALLLFVAAPFYWMLLDASVGSVRGKPITVFDLRRLVETEPGGLPSEVRHELIGYRSYSHNFLAAGSGFRTMHLAMRAFLIVYRDGTRIAVDGGVTPRTAMDEDLEGYDAGAQARVDRALAKANKRLILASRPLHGALEQDADVLSRSATRRTPPAGDEAPRAVAPGVVVIPTPGLGPQANMIYVRSASGREYLLTGDAALIRQNWQEVRPPSRWFTDVERGLDRKELIAMLMTINALKRQAPHMTIVEGHDPRISRDVPRGFSDPEPG